MKVRDEGGIQDARSSGSYPSQSSTACIPVNDRHGITGLRREMWKDTVISRELKSVGDGDDPQRDLGGRAYDGQMEF